MPRLSLHSTYSGTPRFFLALSISFLIALLFASPLLAQGPQPQTLNPAANSFNAPLTPTISIEYDQAISPTTATSRTFAIYSTQTSMLTGSYSFSPTRLAFDPAKPFFPGELVQVSASSGLGYESPTGTLILPLQATVWQFRTEVNKGTAVFYNTSQQLDNNDSTDVVLGDLDGDGDLDAFVGNTDAANLVWFNDGAGNFTDSGQSLGNDQSWGVYLGDLDGDGDLDAYAANANSRNTVWLNDGAGNFTENGQSLGGQAINTRSAGLGDLDGDGDLDILDGNLADQERIWLNDGQGQFTEYDTFTSDTPDDMRLADLDNDGDLDAIFVNRDQNVDIWLNDGQANFTKLTELNLVSGYSMDVGDLNDDGDLDAAIIASSELSIWLGNGAGGFSQFGNSLDIPGTRNIDLGDLDADGDLDIMISSVNTNANTQHLLLNDGQANFTAGATMLNAVPSLATTLGDLDGDGDLDAFITTDGANQVWLNNEETDLMFDGQISQNTATPGETLTYTLNFSNLSDETATDLRFQHWVPEQINMATFTYTTQGPSITITSQVDDPTLFSWHIDQLGPAEGGLITVTAALQAPLLQQSLPFSGSLTSNQIELTPNNNQFEFTVSVPNLAPLALADSGEGYTTTADSAFVTADVLLNDSDANGDVLTVTQVITTNTRGLVQLASNGTFSYDPNGQFDDLNLGEVASDTFSYQITDGNLTATAPVTITIIGVEKIIYLPIVLK